jgi:ornithine carbamoyltransferase
LLRVVDLDPHQIHVILNLAAQLKLIGCVEQSHLLSGRSIAMLFEKPSLRTRVSFEVAMTQLGGHAIYAQGGDFLIGSRETPEDAARTLSRYVDAIVIRTHEHAPLERFADAATVPVINGLSDAHHPCQALADLLTIHELAGGFAGRKIAFIGDANNNVATSLAQAALAVGMTVHFGCPSQCHPRSDVIEAAANLGKAHKAYLRIFASPERAVRDADVIYTDVWVSMGEKAFEARKRAALLPYQVNAKLLASAKSDVIVMHCLPAHRGEEIGAEVIDGPRSFVYHQAENRLHAQKALLIALLTDLSGVPTA